MAHDAHGRDLPGRFTIDDDQTKLTRADDDQDANAYRLGISSATAPVAARAANAPGSS